MRIIQCPKGGRVPEGYCRDSCLNYPRMTIKDKRASQKKLRQVAQGKGKISICLIKFFDNVLSLISVLYAENQYMERAN